MVIRFLSYCLFITALSYTGLTAQTRLSIQVVDASDKAPVPFATIYIPAKEVAFSTNSDGFFWVNVADLEEKSELIISSLGYEEYRTTLAALSGQNMTLIELSPNYTMLDEILVEAKKEKPEEFVDQVSRSLKRQLGQDPYYLFTFYKESLKVAGEFVGFTEGYGILFVSGYQPGYHRRNELFAYDLAQWKNIRRSDYKIKADCDTTDRVMGIEKLLKAKAQYLFSGPLNKRFDAFEFTIDSIFQHQEDEVLVVKFQPQSDEVDYSGEVWITENNNDLIRMKVNDPMLSKTINSRCNTYDSAFFEIAFVAMDDKYYLSMASLTSYSIKDKKLVSEELLLRGGEFRNEETAPLNYDQRMVVFNEMVNPVISYDAEFWQTHGEQLSEKMKTDLNNDLPLEEQFFKMNGRRLIPLPDEYNSYEELYQESDLFQQFMLNSDF